MPIIWIASQAAPKAGQMTQAAQQNLAAGLAFLGWVIAAGTAYWFGDDNPPVPHGATCTWEEFFYPE